VERISQKWFSTRWALTPAADNVTVMINPVAPNPMSVKIRSLLGQYDSSRSSIDRLPSPCGLSCATRRYIGNAPNRVTKTSSTSVATGASAQAVVEPSWPGHIR